MLNRETKEADNKEITKKPEIKLFKKSNQISETITPQKKVPEVVSEPEIKIVLNENSADENLSLTKTPLKTESMPMKETTITKPILTSEPHTHTNTLSNIPPQVLQPRNYTQPIHEPKVLEKKPGKGNDILNYTMNSQTRVINKIPKGKYGYIEDYDLIRAEKFLSKRRTDIKYDTDMIYGMPSSRKNDLQNNAKDIIENKPIIDENIKAPKVESSFEDKSFLNNNNIIKESSPTEEDSNGEIEDKKDDKEKSKKKNKPTQRQTEFDFKGNKNFQTLFNENVDDNNKNNSTISGKSKESHRKGKSEKKKAKKKSVDETPDITKNKNFELLFQEMGTQTTGKKDSVKSDLSNDSMGSVPKAKQRKSVEQNKNKNFNQLKGKSQKTDQNSCSNCEPVYRLSIMNNIPLKVLKCLVCGNVINTSSLLFYLEKYKDEIVSKEKGRKQVAADEGNINTAWGNWIYLNNKKIKEDNAYALEGKSSFNTNSKRQKEVSNRRSTISQFNDYYRPEASSYNPFHDETIGGIEGMNLGLDENITRRQKLVEFKKKLEHDANETEL